MTKLGKLFVLALIAGSGNGAFAAADVMVFGSGIGVSGSTMTLQTKMNLIERGNNNLDERCEHLARSVKNSLDEISQDAQNSNLFGFEATSFVRTTSTDNKEYICGIKVKINDGSFKFVTKETKSISLSKSGEDPNFDASILSLASQLKQDKSVLNYFQTKRGTFSTQYSLRFVQVVKSN